MSLLLPALSGLLARAAGLSEIGILGRRRFRYGVTAVVLLGAVAVAACAGPRPP